MLLIPPLPVAMPPELCPVSLWRGALVGLLSELPLAAAELGVFAGIEAGMGAAAPVLPGELGVALGAVLTEPVALGLVLEG
jgi:hypothetical protein